MPWRNKTYKWNKDRDPMDAICLYCGDESGSHHRADPVVEGSVKIPANNNICCRGDDERGEIFKQEVIRIFGKRKVVNIKSVKITI